MEKQGMGRRKRSVRAGLLTARRFALGFFVIFLLTRGALPLFAQSRNGGNGESADGENAGAAENKSAVTFPEVQFNFSSASPVVNTPWSIVILVNHPLPQEVNVRPPRFPPSIVLERVRTEARIIRTAAADGAPPAAKRWTRVEFLFTPQRQGPLALDPFELSLPGGRSAKTAETRLRIQAQPGERRYQPRYRWLSPAAPAVPGEKRALILELSGWDPRRDVPEGLFRGRSPDNAILEEAPPAAAGEGIYRYTISLIALEGSGVVLAPFSIQAETYTLNVPGITVPLLPARPKEAAAPAETVPEEEIPPVIPAVPFPGRASANPPGKEGASPPRGRDVFPFLRGEYDRVITRVEALWEENRRTAALAEIRRNERDSFAGPFLVPLRREMEKALGLAFTEDERWRPLKFEFFTLVILGIALVSIGTVLFFFRSGKKTKTGRGPGLSPRDGLSKMPADEGKTVTSGGQNGFRTVVILVILAGLFLIFLAEGMGNFSSGGLVSGGSAVLEKTAAYRVPDYKGAVTARFEEGQTVTTGDYRGDWCYAESPDGRSGWIPKEALAAY